MIGKRTIQTGLVGAILAGGSMVVLPGIASASVRAHSFATAQKQLEQELANRVTQLGRLAADVKGSSTLSPQDLLTLDTNVANATMNINMLVAKVPTDMTFAQLNYDRSSMLKQNRVFAVLTPQVFQTIEADSFAAQVKILQNTDEPLLQSAVHSLVGQPGYKNAVNHYISFVTTVNKASEDSSNVAMAVLAQTPADYPGDTHVFTQANHELLNAGIALAHAAYDENIIGLASGGYSGS